MQGSRTVTDDAGPLTTLGEKVRRARQRKGWNQKQVAEELNKQLGPSTNESQIHQSFVARLENGKVFPSAKLLKAVTEVLGGTYLELVAAVLRDRFLDGSGELAMPYEKGVLTLQQLAEWEADEHHKEIWIVAERYVDDAMSSFKRAVGTIVARGGMVTFLVPEEFGKSLQRYKKDVEKPSSTGRLWHVGVGDEDRSLMAASYVIANPNRENDPAYPQGYLILNNENGQPCIAVRMSRAECENRLTWLRTYKAEREAKAAHQQVDERQPR